MNEEIRKRHPHCEHLRDETFEPCSLGPKFKLSLWDTNERLADGKCLLAYEFTQDGKVLFSGADFGCSPLHCVDSDQTVHSLMTFLCLPAGGTDREYFDSYNEDQLRFRDEDAEAVYQAVRSKFDMDCFDG